MLRNTTDSWGWLARFFHWSMAVLIAGQAGLGFYAHELGLSPRKLDLLMWHKSTGITLLFLAIFRLLWFFSNPKPGQPQGAARWELTAARASHIALYFLMVTIPLSGWLMNSAKNIPFSLFRIVPWPALIAPNEALGKFFAQCHENLVKALIAVLLVHIGAALWHHFFRHDNILRRMWRAQG